MTVISVFALAAAALFLTIAPRPGRSAIRQQLHRANKQTIPAAKIRATRPLPQSAWPQATLASTTRDSTKAMP